MRWRDTAWGITAVLPLAFVIGATWHQTDAQLVPERQITVSTTTTTAPTTTIRTVTVVEKAERVSRPHEYFEVSIPVWTGNIPEHYGPGSGCNSTQATIVANVMWQAGASDDSVEWMLGIISRESLCQSAAFNDTPATGDLSYGLCQINARSGWYNGALSHYNPEDFAGNFALNAQACTDLWVLCGQGPWNYGGYYCEPEELE